MGVEPMDERFLVDVMLGRLAKWLRILGYDACCRRVDSGRAMDRPRDPEARLLITRSAKTLEAHGRGVFIRSDHVRDQLRQLMDEGWIRPDPERCFGRCVVCNTVLTDADPESVRESVPEYVRLHHTGGYRRCPACGRTYWQGSHGKRMVDQLASWGILMES